MPNSSPHDQLIQVSAAIIIRGEGDNLELLSARRSPSEAFGGGWEFPGGKWDPGEDGLTAMHRELIEELNVTLDVIHHLEGPLDNRAWPMGDTYALHVWICRQNSEVEIKLEEQHDDSRWLTLDNAEAVGWLEVDLPPLRAAVEWLRQNPQISA